ncbi:MAG TPA: hypothetical protein PKL49_11210 [Steroidobacteraceae bacterium]|nr:hypothetical protein [Steroidobacteraceae bacterium]
MAKSIPMACLAIAALLPAAYARAPAAQVEIYDRTQQEVLPQYRRFGARWIAGETGHEYAVRIRNRSDVRILAVVSVDGVNAVTGETASPAQSGYVIEPGDSVSVAGWRKSLDRTAAFVFVDPAQSYAARTGRPDDVGVIGVALFRERTAQVAQAKQKVADANAGAQRSAESRAAAPTASIGTGHGRKEHSPAHWTRFERASRTPDSIVTLRYESRERLLAMGVIPRVRPPRTHADPFPAAHGFVPDP